MGRKARLKKQRRNGGAARDLAREIRRAFEATATGVASMVLEGLPEERKVSDALLELTQPLLDALDPNQRTHDRLDQIVMLGGLAWNAHLMPAPEEFVRETLAKLPDDDDLARDVAVPLVLNLLERRRTLFPDDRRQILNTDVVMKPTGRFDVTAAYAPFPIRF